MNRYEKSWRYLFDKLPAWRRNAIIDDQKAGKKDSRILDEFVKSVCVLAESETVIPEPGQVPHPLPTTEIPEPVSICSGCKNDNQ